MNSKLSDISGKLWQKIRYLYSNLILQNFSYLLLSHIISQLLMFAAFSLLARRVSVEAFGKFGYAQAYYSYFLLLLNLGLPILGIKEFAQLSTKEKKVELVNKILSLRLYLFVLLLFPYIIFANVIATDSITLELMLFIGVGLFAIVFELEWYYRAIQKMGYILLGFTLKSLVFLCGIFFLVFNDESLSWAGLIFSGGFISSTLLFFLIADIRSKIRLKLPGNWIVPLLKESFILGLSFILIQVYYNFAILALGAFRPGEEVGYYSAIFKLVMFFLAIVGVYLKAVFPYLAELVGDDKAFKKFVIRFTRIGFILSFVITLMAVAMSEWLLVLAFGEKYAATAWAFQILIFLFWIIASRTLIENSLIIRGSTKKYLIAVSTGVVLNILLNLTFIPLYGISAAAWSAVASEFVFSVTAFALSEFKIVDILKA